MGDPRHRAGGVPWVPTAAPRRAVGGSPGLGGGCRHPGVRAGPLGRRHQGPSTPRRPKSPLFPEAARAGDSLAGRRDGLPGTAAGSARGVPSRGARAGPGQPQLREGSRGACLGRARSSPRAPSLAPSRAARGGGRCRRCRDSPLLPRTKEDALRASGSHGFGCQAPRRRWAVGLRALAVPPAKQDAAGGTAVPGGAGRAENGGPLAWPAPAPAGSRPALCKARWLHRPPRALPNSSFLRLRVSHSVSTFVRGFSLLPPSGCLAPLPAGFQAPRGSPRLDCTVPRLGPNLPPSLAPSPPQHPRTQPDLTSGPDYVYEQRQAITLWQERKSGSRVPAPALPGPSRLPRRPAATRAALPVPDHPSQRSADKRGDEAVCGCSARRQRLGTAGEEVAPGQHTGRSWLAGLGLGGRCPRAKVQTSLRLGGLQGAAPELPLQGPLPRSQRHEPTSTAVPQVSPGLLCPRGR